MKQPLTGDLYVRNVIFGVADSLVSTVGLLSGIDVSGTPKQTIVVTGIVYAFVEAFSMAVGSFLSEQSAEEYRTKSETTDGRPFAGGVVMFVSFVLASFIPIIPYLALGPSLAVWVSMVLSVVALFLVGLASARLSHVRLLAHAVKMALLGGAAILIGVVVGKFVHAA